MSIQEKDTYFCTRPALASKLFASGCKGEIVPNPFKPNLKAWSFTRDEKLDEIVNDYLATAKRKTASRKVRKHGEAVAFTASQLDAIASMKDVKRIRATLQAILASLFPNEYEMPADAFNQQEIALLKSIKELNR